jgi:hypothetical protein
VGVNEQARARGIDRDLDLGSRLDARDSPRVALHEQILAAYQRPM